MTIKLNEFKSGLNKVVIGLREFSDSNDDFDIDMDGIEIAIEGLVNILHSIQDYETSLIGSTKIPGV